MSTIKKYRPEIDGLRAIAVLPVIFFHAGFNLFDGGFIGVDIFFVISGYLITTILIVELEKNRFSILNFYERRARRILPALFLIMLICIPFAWMWMIPEELKNFSQSLVAVSLFASNILFWRESGYFDTAAEEKPLLHTWSLAVEEQYYFIFPIFLLMFWRFGKHHVFWIVGFLTILSLIASEIGWRSAPSANFFLAPFRMWELLAGSLSAFIVREKGILKNNFLSFFGLALIIFSVFTYDKTVPFPSFYSMLPILGVILIILFAHESTYSAKILSIKWLVAIGLISYSAYLWHQPIFAFARIRFMVHPSNFTMLFLIAFSFLLAFASWKFIEKPFRDKNIFSRKQIFTFSFLGIIFFLTIGLLGHFEKIQSRFTEVSFDNWEDKSPCVVSKETDFNNIKDDLVSQCFGKENNFILIGDSHAESLSKQLRAMFKKNDANLITLLNNACLPISGTSRTPIDNNCLNNIEVYWDFIQSTNATVLMSSRWRLHMEGNRFNNNEGGIEYGVSGLHKVISSNENIFLYFEKFIKHASKKNHILIIDQIPEAGWNVSTRNSRILKLDKISKDISTSYDVYLKANQRVNQLFNNLLNDDFIELLNTSELVCNTKYIGRCLNTIDGNILYRDNNHPSPYLAEIISDEMQRKIFN